MSKSTRDLFAIPVDATTNSLEELGATDVQAHFTDFDSSGVSDTPRAIVPLVAWGVPMAVVMLDVRHAAMATMEYAMRFTL
jgi:hypothetical protein